MVQYKDLEWPDRSNKDKQLDKDKAQQEAEDKQQEENK